MQVTLTKIDIVNKVSSGGKKFSMFEIMTDKHGDKKLTKFVDKDDPFKYVRVGDTVEIVEKINGRFTNFEFVDMKTNANSGSVITPAYNPPAPYVPPATNNPPVQVEPSPVDRNYNLLLRIAQQVGVQLTDTEMNNLIGF